MKVKKGAKESYDRYFAEMTFSVIEGTIIILLGAVFFVMYSPELAPLLIIFLVLVFICRGLEITKWNKRHDSLYALFQLFILMDVIGTISWWGYEILNRSFPTIATLGRGLALFIVYAGSIKLLSLFQKYNYVYVEEED